MSIICFCTLALLFATINSQSYEDENILNELFYSPITISAKPRIVKANLRSNITLVCSDDCGDYRNYIKWQFKPCSSDVKAVPCEKFYESAYQLGSRDRWLKVYTKQFKPVGHLCNLEISDISRTNGGLYRCIVNNKIRGVHELVVSDLMGTDKMSKIVINPKNITIPTNTELVIRCFVNNPSSIMWFKETDANSYDIMYDGHYYSKLSTAVYPNHVLESTEYQSKLSIRKVSLSDSGVYVCVGVNEDNIKTEVNVVTVIGYNWEPHTSFSLLFLIPLVFALIPITAWLCYFRRKRKEYDRQRTKLMLNTRNHPSSAV